MRHHRARIFASILCVSLVALALAELGFAHQEDPKARSRQAPYTGMGYRSGAGAVGPGGGSGPSGPGTMFASQGITLLSWLTLPELGSGLSNGNSCWGYTSPSGREYALMGHSGGVTVVEITIPGDPQVIAMVPGPTSLWRDVRTYSTYAYAVSEGGGGIQVIDLSAVDAGTVTLVNTVLTGGSPEATHTVWIDVDSGFIYRCGGGNNGLRIYSLANPALPAFVGSWGDRYVHEVQVVTYTSGPYAGKQVAFACGGLNGGWVDTGIDILDVTNKSNIVPFSQLIYANGEYSHQACLSPDKQWLFLDDELDEEYQGIPTSTLVFDVSNLSAPVLVDEFTNGNTAIGHNLYTKGSRIYEANYRSGLRVFDASDPLNAYEVAWFDTYPADDAADFNGLWNVYPYFSSGVVIGSDMERGLFVWQVDDLQLSFSYPGGIPTQFDPAGDEISVEITAAPGATLDTSSPSLWVDTGSGFGSAPLVPLGGSLYRGDIPPSVCGTPVRWFVRAEPLVGTPVSDPSGAPSASHQAMSQVGRIQLAISTMETDAGWVAGAPGDTATSGAWVRGDPVGTAAQPEDDHSAGTGTLCWYTGAGIPGGGVGDADVDGGATTLLSPVYDLSAAFQPVIGYWRWYSNHAGGSPGQDVFQVDISSDGGQSWVPVETVGPIGPGSAGGWYSHTLRVSDLVPLTAFVRLRFVANDAGPGSVIEAAIDDLLLVDTVCVDCNLNGIDDAVDLASGASQDADADGIPDECGCPVPFIRGDANADLVIDLSDAIQILSYLFSSGASPAPLDSADFDAGGAIDISDVVSLLAYLFSSGSPPAPPFPAVGCP